MKRLTREFRLIPVVLLATIALLGLKVSGLVLDGGYTLAERLQRLDKSKMQIAKIDSETGQPELIVASDDARQPGADDRKQPWAQEMFNYNTGDGRDVTGSVGHGESKDDKAKSDGPKLKVSDKAPGDTKIEANGVVVPVRPGHINSPGERAILESLQERHKQLDARSRDLDMRENLLKAAEKRVEAKLTELKTVETRVKTAIGVRQETETKRLKGLITMYANMKPKDAARIFDRLDMNILVEVANTMNPRTMSAILAQMKPEAAERLTVELANRAGAQAGAPDPSQLPKIEGKPSVH
jgi:flagellar motility protein MotE (MotC chaperone)